MESGLSWYSEDGKASHKLDSSSFDSGSLKTEAPSKWRKKPPSMSEDFGLKGELKKPASLGQPGSFKKGRNPPIGVTSPITHTSQSTLKVAGNLFFRIHLLYLYPSFPFAGFSSCVGICSNTTVSNLFKTTKSMPAVISCWVQM